MSRVIIENKERTKGLNDLRQRPQGVFLFMKTYNKKQLFQINPWKGVN
jgi:hypothetical protein